MRSAKSAGEKQSYCLRGDFLVHCHVEMHMMSGMAAVVRSIQEVHLTDAEVASLGHALPLADEWYCRQLCHDQHHDDDLDDVVHDGSDSRTAARSW